MLKFLDQILSEFRDCFRRTRTFEWFVILVVGIMVRTDLLGVTSVVRSLNLDPGTYELLINFFHSYGWDLSAIRTTWMEIVSKRAPLLICNGHAVLICDGVKQVKEARYSPGTKKMPQDSETQSKPRMIHGQLWGVVSALIGNCHLGQKTSSALPLSAELQDGLASTAEWDGSTKTHDSHPLQLLKNVTHAASTIGKPAYLLADSYFVTRKNLRHIDAYNADAPNPVDMISKCRRDAAAYKFPPPKLPGQRGAPSKKGDKIVLLEVFTLSESSFKTKRMFLYGKRESVKYYHEILLWGGGLYRPILFVFVRYRNVYAVLFCTDCDANPLDVIRLYCARFKIEDSFRVQKQSIGGLKSHFWTSFCPRLNYYKKKTDPDPLLGITDAHARNKILSSVRATEMYMMIACIAHGLLQMLPLQYPVDRKQLRFQRSFSSERISEENMMQYLRNIIFIEFGKKSQLPIIQIIQGKQAFSEAIQAASA